jgi:putrescine importer
LYGMGKDNVLPQKFFGYTNPKNASPIYNILLIGVLAVVGALMLNYQKTAELINFAALIAFMGVNIAAINHLFFRSSATITIKRIVTDLLVPLAGFLFCFWIWIKLPNSSIITGGIWLLIGIVYLAISTKGFKIKPAELDFKDV